MVAVTARAPKTKREAERAGAGRFVRSRKVYVLTFDDPALAGLEVRARSVPLGRFLQLVGMAASLDAMAEGEFTSEDAAAIEGLFTGFADALVSWNLDERLDDETIPVPTTAEGVMAQDVDFMLDMITAWLQAIGAVDVPLGDGSNGGKPFLEAGIPMQAPTSPSPSS